MSAANLLSAQRRAGLRDILRSCRRGLLLTPTWFLFVAVLAVFAGSAVADDSQRVATYVDPNSGITVEGRLDVSANELNLRLTMPSGIRLNARYGIWIKPMPGTGRDWSGELPYTHMEDRDYFDDPLLIDISYRPQRGQQTKVALTIEYGWCDLSEGICVPAETVLRF